MSSTNEDTNTKSHNEEPDLENQIQQETTEEKQETTEEKQETTEEKQETTEEKQETTEEKQETTEENKDDNISELSDEEVTVKEDNKGDWEEDLNEFDPSESSVTGIIRPYNGYKTVVNKNKEKHVITKETRELGIVEHREHAYYEKHKQIFEKYSNESNHIRKETLLNILFDKFDYIQNVSDLEKATIRGVLLDKYLKDYINQIGSVQNISFLDYFSLVKHLDYVYLSNYSKILNYANEYTNTRLEQDNLRNKETTLRSKEYELDIIEKQKEIDIRKQILNIDDRIQIYTPDKYNKNCCNLLKRITGQNIIDDFDKIYDTIINLPSLNNYEKNTILTRFHSILTYCTNNYNSVSKLYDSTQICLIACSILNPALLSINSDKNNAHYETIFWTVWISQLCVSLITGYVSLFKWDKKYFLFNAYKTKINQEIWLFIALSGKHYKPKHDNPYNHSPHLSTFLNRLETFYRQLKISEIEIENTKDDEDNSNNNGDNGVNNGNHGNVKQDAINLMKSRQNNQLQSENTDLKVMRNEMEDENRRLQTKLHRVERIYR